MFPEFLEFDETRHRTPKIKPASMHIYESTNKLQSKKNGANLLFSDLPQEVTRLGLEPRTPTLKVLCSTN